MATVGIGLPVCNGEKYIREALESLLAQTYSDFEIIICDNASTDRTREICCSVVERDRRVHYHRNDINIGAAENFNLAFKLSKGEYFKWAAHDDICAPHLIARCVNVLNRDPDIVIAYPKTAIIDKNGKVIDTYEIKLPTDSSDPVKRFAALLRGHKCFEIFGLIRRSALAQTPLMGRYAHGDGILLARLSLVGRFEEIDEKLFFARRHEDQSMSMVNDYRSYAVWFEPKLRNKMVFPWWKMQLEFFLSVHRAPLNIKQRYQCYKHVYWNTRAKRKYLKNDIVFHIKELIGRKTD